MNIHDTRLLRAARAPWIAADLLPENPHVAADSVGSLVAWGLLPPFAGTNENKQPDMLVHPVTVAQQADDPARGLASALAAAGAS